MEGQEVIVRRGLVKKHAAVDYEVWQWKTNLEQSRGAQRVTKAEIQNFAVEAYKRIGITNFKASNGWYRRWRVRWQVPDVVRPKDFKKKGENDDESKLCSQNNPNTTKEVLLKNKMKGSCKKLLTKRKKEIDKNNLKRSIKLKHIKKSCQQTSLNMRNIRLDSSLKGKNINGIEHTIKKIGYDSDFPYLLGLIRVQNVNVLESEPFSSDTEPFVVSSDSRCSKMDLDACESKPNQIISDNCSSAITNLVKTRDYFRDNVSTFNVDGQFKSNTREESKQIETNRIINMTENIVPATSNLCGLYNIETMLYDIENTNKGFLDNLDEQNMKGKYPHGRDALLTHNDSNSSSEKETVINYMSDSGISLPSTSSSLVTPYSNNTPLFIENDLDFGDHELFCDSCEDFHPLHKSSLHAHCCKQKKNTSDNSLLSCVFEKKDLNIVNLSSSVPDEKEPKEKTSEESMPEDIHLINPSVMLPKGKRYLVQFKSKVVNYALSHNAKEAAIKFKVNRGTVSEWVTERKRLCGSVPCKRSINKDILSLGDSEFLTWLESSKFNLTNDLIKQKAFQWLNGEKNNKNCQWLYMYAQRLNGIEDSSVKKRYISYPDVFKRVAVFYAQTHSNMAAARVFGVARRRIFEWQEMSSDIKEKAVVDTASNVTDEGVDKQVFKWYCNEETPPSSKQVRCKALELYRLAGYNQIQCGAQWYYRWRARHKLPPPRSQLYDDLRLLTWALTELDNNHCVTHNALAAQAIALGHAKISRGWTFRFCKKHHQLLLNLPGPTTPLPSVMEKQISEFRQVLQNTIDTCSYGNKCIVAMDEVPLHFLPKDQTKKPLLVRRPGFESCQASLVVSSLSDGTLLPSMFIFKGMAPKCRSDSLVISTVSETGLLTNDIMEQWLRNVCFKELQEGGGVLITDCFEIHTTKEVQQTLLEHHIHHSVIPGGCAFRLLPIIDICQLFKAMLEEMCRVSLANQTKALKSPSPDQLYNWCVRVHKHLAKHQKENIKSAFKKMLFSVT